jgi:hypothetical protein
MSERKLSRKFFDMKPYTTGLMQLNRGSMLGF